MSRDKLNGARPRTRCTERQYTATVSSSADSSAAPAGRRAHATNNSRNGDGLRYGWPKRKPQRRRTRTVKQQNWLNRNGNSGPWILFLRIERRRLSLNIFGCNIIIIYVLSIVDELKQELTLVSASTQYVELTVIPVKRSL